jgi:ribosomal protein L16 Arg81 hydroxylase
MLTDILAPLPVDKFFRDYWTRQFVHIPGPPEKFHQLFDWSVLNQALEQHSYSPGRLRLVKAGKSISATRYLERSTVLDVDLMNELANGATLVFNSCERVHRPLRDLCERLERLLHVRVTVNLYAGWRKDNGFNVHWDDQDTLILQVRGRKHWKTWPPTRRYPFRDDVVDTSPETRPAESPVWEGILEEGGMLNMPRGWWHVAYPLDEPCLHLTVTVKNLNGVDFLRWYAHRMKSSDHVRMDVPVVGTETERRAWLDAVLDDIRATWDYGMLDQYLADVDRRATSHPKLNLPQVGTSAVFVDKSTALQLALPRPLHFNVTNGTAHFWARGTSWTTIPDLVPALLHFNDGLPHALAELPLGDDPRLRSMIMALAVKGVLRRA